MEIAFSNNQMPKNQNIFPVAPTTVKPWEDTHFSESLGAPFLLNRDASQFRIGTVTQIENLKTAIDEKCLSFSLKHMLSFK